MSQAIFKSDDFEFELGQEVKDLVTGYTGIVECRSQWLNGCNTYGIRSRVLKDGMLAERQHLDAPQLRATGNYLEDPDPPAQPRRRTGGPEKPIHRNIKPE